MWDDYLQFLDFINLFWVSRKNFDDPINPSDENILYSFLEFFLYTVWKLQNTFLVLF